MPILVQFERFNSDVKRWIVSYLSPHGWEKLATHKVFVVDPESEEKEEEVEAPIGTTILVSARKVEFYGNARGDDIDKAGYVKVYVDRCGSFPVMAIKDPERRNKDVVLDTPLGSYTCTEVVVNEEEDYVNVADAEYIAVALMARFVALVPSEPFKYKALISTKAKPKPE
ncbi:hypothetical protein [Thermofilum pendens]|uniref:Uncharacterized protein n=1 Tax=Thermofilum pendens (strain DSM 2475 / Hrk 5) TaxID=368408 RepID=A1S1E6_THEPD|nr:hypothetical protein [Thermofilum pendens]ABL79276.1 hypothetical protein Tpen_1881 [Thermofilum pendens Hrk 5]